MNVTPVLRCVMKAVTDEVNCMTAIKEANELAKRAYFEDVFNSCHEASHHYLVSN